MATLNTYRVQATVFGADIRLERQIKAKSAVNAVDRMQHWLRQEGYQRRHITAEDETGHEFYEIGKTW